MATTNAIVADGAKLSALEHPQYGPTAFCCPLFVSVFVRHILQSPPLGQSVSRHCVGPERNSALSIN